MAYYATVKHHSSISSWEELPGARSLTHAKRLATIRFGEGYLGHVIHLVECSDSEAGQLNDMPTHRRIIGRKKWAAYDY